MNNQKGQTIIEAVVAIAVISLAMLGFLSQATSNFVMGRTSENHFIAYNLASEAIEVSRNVRDSNWLKGCIDPAVPAKCFLWNSGLANGTDYSAVLNFNATTGNWLLDFSPKDLATCGGACLAGDKTKFSRMVFLQPVCKDKFDCLADGGVNGICGDGEKCAGEQIGIKVTAQVGWSEASGLKTYEATEYLYNWK
ncbi:MAG: prepilin-type N-terminal cleavage/methylation domain-containing protein [Candidatus Falkowbacteria bacterium]